MSQKTLHKPESSSSHFASDSDRTPGGIWQSAIRAGGEQKELRRDNQFSSANVSISENHNGWALAVSDYMGNTTPITIASSDPLPAVVGDGLSGLGVEVASDVLTSLARILRFAETCRVVLAEGEALRPQFLA